MPEPVAHKKKARSPSYPAIGLREALNRARTLYDQERRNAAPVNAILDHWDYSPGSGPGILAVAALRKFGLLEYVGTGTAKQARLTDLALKILLDDRDVSPERDEAIRQAAFTPAIHSDIRRRYPDGLPSDGTLKHYLTYDRKFTEPAAKQLIAELKDTLGFIGEGSGGAMPPEIEPQGVPPVSSVDRVLGREGVPPMPATATAGGGGAGSPRGATGRSSRRTG